MAAYIILAAMAIAIAVLHRRVRALERKARRADRTPQHAPETIDARDAAVAAVERHELNFHKGNR